MAGLNSLVEKAKALFSQRGGMEAAKEDAQELKDIHASEGSMSNKAKDAVDALKDPGAKGPDRADSPGAPDAPERTPGPERQ